MSDRCAEAVRNIKSAMENKEITVSVLKYGDKILLLRRHKNKQFDSGKWEFISGFINGNNSFVNQAKHQVLKETGIDAVLAKKGYAFKIKDSYGTWLIHPFLFDASTDKAKIVAEDHSEYKWLRPADIKNYDIVEGLMKNLDALNFDD